MIMCSRSPKRPTDSRPARTARVSVTPEDRQGGPVFLPRRGLSPIARALLAPRTTVARTGEPRRGDIA